MGPVGVPLPAVGAAPVLHRAEASGRTVAVSGDDAGVQLRDAEVIVEDPARNPGHGGGGEMLSVTGHPHDVVGGLGRVTGAPNRSKLETVGLSKIQRLLRVEPLRGHQQPRRRLAADQERQQVEQ